MIEDVNILLKLLTERDVDYAVYGTYGLYFYKPEILNVLNISDCDVILNPEEKNIIRCVQLLNELELPIKIWEEPLQNNNWNFEIFKGKFYFRTSINNFQIDITYEHSYSLRYDQIIYDSIKIKVLPESDIIEIKRLSNRINDRSFLENYSRL